MYIYLKKPTFSYSSEKNEQNHPKQDFILCDIGTDFIASGKGRDEWEGRENVCEKTWKKDKTSRKASQNWIFFKFFMNRILALPLRYQREKFYTKKYDNDKIDDDDVPRNGTYNTYVLCIISRRNKWNYMLCIKFHSHFDSSSQSLLCQLRKLCRDDDDEEKNIIVKQKASFFVYYMFNIFNNEKEKMLNHSKPI